MRRKFLVAILALLPLVAVPSLSRAAEPSATEEWNQVTAAAKKEGEVVVYNAAIGADYYKAVIASFEKHYGIRVRTLDVRASEITERLRSLQDDLGIDGILAELNCGGLVPHRQVMTALQLLCQKVMPRFH